MVLQMIFGMSMKGIVDYLNFCMHLLVRVLLSINEARVQRPDDETIYQFMDVVARRHPSLDRWSKNGN